MRSVRLSFVTVAKVTTLLAAGGSVAAASEPLSIAYPVWVGYGPLFVAVEKGFFAAEGLKVQMTEVEEGDWEGLRDGQFDAISTTLDEVAAWSDPSQRVVCVLALDESRGGDGVVAMNGVTSIADLKGKAVALQDHSVSQFFVTTLLHEAGLTSADIEPVNLAAPDAIEAFLLQEVDAVVTWEPWLTEAASVDHGHLLEISAARLGLIVDCLATTAALFERRRSDFLALARAWAAAVDDYRSHPTEAIEIMARHVGGWLEDPAAFAKTLEGVRLYGRAAKAIAVWSDLGILKTQVSPEDIIGYGIWN